MRLADWGRVLQQARVLVAGRQRVDATVLDRRLEREVEAAGVVPRGIPESRKDVRMRLSQEPGSSSRMGSRITMLSRSGGTRSLESTRIVDAAALIAAGLLARGRPRRARDSRFERAQRA